MSTDDRKPPTGKDGPPNNIIPIGSKKTEKKPQVPLTCQEALAETLRVSQIQLELIEAEANIIEAYHAYQSMIAHHVPLEIQERFHQQIQPLFESLRAVSRKIQSP